jgi:hypothetical protein
MKTLFRSLLLLASLLASAAAAADAPRTILFIDDEEVLYRSGTKRRVGEFRKFEGNPVIAPDRPWESSTIGWNSQYRDPKTGKFQLWYQAHSQRNDDRRIKNTVCYAESTDGQIWVKPALGLFPYYDAKDTNIVLIGNGGYGDRYCCSVLVDEREPDPARRYKMVYYDWTVGAEEKLGAGSHVAFSPDGIRWTKVPGPALRGAYGRTQDPPVLGGAAYPFGEIGSVSDVLDAMYDARRQRYVVYAKAWIDAPDGKLFWKRAIARTESRDFVAWSPPQLVLAPDEHDGVRPARAGGTRTGVQLHGAPVFVRHGVYFALLQVADFETHGLQPIELALSRDGVTWSRPFRGTPFLPVGEPGRFDAGRIWSNATPIVLEDEIRFYYGAYEHPWKFGQQPYPWDGKTHIPKSGLGLATLPLDRFAGIRPLERLGHVTLKPRALAAGTTLTLNARAAGGAIRVELLDERGYRIAGYTKAEAVPITGDGLRQRVTWNTRPDGTVPAGSFSVRVHLDNAELFAVTLH